MISIVFAFLFGVLLCPVDASIDSTNSNNSTTSEETSASICTQIRDGKIKILKLECRKSGEAKIEFYLLAERNYEYVVPFANFTYGPSGKVARLTIGGDYTKSGITQSEPIENSTIDIVWLDNGLVVGAHFQRTVDEFIECAFPKAFPLKLMLIAFVVAVICCICAHKMYYVARHFRDGQDANELQQWQFEHEANQMNTNQSDSPNQTTDTSNKVQSTLSSIKSKITSTLSGLLGSAKSPAKPIKKKKKKANKSKKIVKKNPKPPVVDDQESQE